MNFEIGDKVRINKKATIEDFTKDNWNGCQFGTLKILKDCTPKNYTFTIQEKIGNKCVKLNGYLVNVNILEKVKELLDDKEKDFLKDLEHLLNIKITEVEKKGLFDDMEFLNIIFIGLEKREEMLLPYFKKNTMYKKLEKGKKYTREELNLDA